MRIIAIATSCGLRSAAAKLSKIVLLKSTLVASAGKALYAKLDEFEQDLHMHVHLENNILFPKAIELEKSFQVLN